jgi:hypothetical protein
MNTFRRSSILGSLFAVCFFFAPFTPSSDAARQSSADGSALLFIKRSPDLGNLAYVAVRLDGRDIGSVLWAQNFECSIPSGRHAIEVQLAPAEHNYLPSTIIVDVQPGRSYAFMAMKKGGYLVLGRL